MPNRSDAGIVRAKIVKAPSKYSFIMESDLFFPDSEHRITIESLHGTIPCNPCDMDDNPNQFRITIRILMVGRIAAQYFSDLYSFVATYTHCIKPGEGRFYIVTGELNLKNKLGRCTLYPERIANENDFFRSMMATSEHYRR